MRASHPFPSTRLLACDRADTVMRRLDAQGSRTFNYTCFGSPSPGTDNAPGFAFNGQYREPDSAYLLGHGYRSYRPALQRFTSPDSLSPFAKGGLNAYAYCRNEPINRRDPSGHVDENLIPGIALGAGVLAGLLGLRGIVKKFGTGKITRFAAVLAGTGATAVLFGGMALAAKGDMKSASGAGGLVVLAIGGAVALSGKKIPALSSLSAAEKAALKRARAASTEVATSAMTPRASRQGAVSSQPIQPGQRQPLSAEGDLARRSSDSSLTSEGSYAMFEPKDSVNGYPVYGPAKPRAKILRQK